MQPVRVGIIGTGFGITTHLPAFRALPGVEVTAIMSANLPRAEAVAREHGIPAAYDDVRRLVEAPDIDLVSIASTPDVHLEQVLTCLDAGKPLLCEKPVSNDLDEVRKMAEAARGAGVVNAVNHEFRYMPMNRRVRELLHSGELGRPLHVSMRMNDDLATYRRFPEWYWQREKGGGALMLLYSHYIDLAFSWFGDLTGVAGTTSRYYPTREVRSSDRAESDDDGSKQMAVDVEDAVAFAARLPDGGLLSFDFRTYSTSCFTPYAGVEGCSSTNLPTSDKVVSLAALLMFSP